MRLGSVFVISACSGSSPFVGADGGLSDATPASDVPADAALYSFDAYPDGSAGMGSGTCLPGAYDGTFAGMVTASLAGFPVSASTHGTVHLTLDKSGSGEFYAIRDGHLMGDASGNPYTADVGGTLNCAIVPPRLEDGMLTNGSVTFSRGPLTATVHFEGPLTGDYDGSALPPAFLPTSTWNIHQTAGGSALITMGMGMGTWNAAHTP